MTLDTTSQPVQLAEETYRPRSLLQLTVHRFRRHRMAMVGLCILLAIVLYIGIGSLVFSETYANYNDTSIRLQPPSAQHPFGTDTVGRDILARTVYGGQISLIIGLFAVLVEVTLGTLIGAVSGYYGGIVDSLLMRFTEALMSIPSLLLLLVMAKFLSGKIPDIMLFGRTFSGSVVVIILIIGLTGWTYLARIVRSSFLSLKESDFVLAARALGIPDRRIILSHILPNTMASVIVAATLGVATAILSEAYISFLGLGVRPPTATWGSMLDGAYDYLEQAPWLWFYPGLLIILTVMSINFVGDGLRDALDPRSEYKV
ncbi:MAG: ABC transporter permease [Anaerolineae bacterium]|nr:ABC transporter permease [Anaerolineae bacterium]